MSTISGFTGIQLSVSTSPSLVVSGTTLHCAAYHMLPHNTYNTQHCQHSDYETANIVHTSFGGV